MVKAIDLLDCLMRQAHKIYYSLSFEGDNDWDFFVIKGNDKKKDVWFVLNGDSKLTAMLAGDF
ncbi:MAG: hypothetical protein ABH879_01090 [archaeon]